MSNLDRAIVFYNVDDAYEPHRKEIEEFTQELFGDKLSMYPYHLTSQRQWQQELERVLTNDDKVLWYMGNYDHPYISYDDELVLKAENHILEAGEHASLYYSHWAEHIRLTTTPMYMSGLGYENPGFFTIRWKCTDAIQMMNRDLFVQWWSGNDCGDAYMPKSDRNQAIVSPEYLCYLPMRELCRHYDGYAHVHMNNEASPPLVIPPGFFEKNIRIRYGFKDYVEGWVNIDPTNPLYRVLDQNGTDYRWLLEDIPMCWKDRTSEVVVNNDLDPHLALQGRNAAVRSMADANFVGVQQALPPGPPVPESLLSYAYRQENSENNSNLPHLQ